MNPNPVQNIRLHPNPDRQPWFSHLLWFSLYSIKYYLVPTVRQFVWGEIDRCEICVLRSCWDNTSSTDFYSDQGGLKVQSHEISIATKGGLKVQSHEFLYRLMTLRRHYVPVCLHNDHAARSKISLKTIPECLKYRITKKLRTVDIELLE